MSIRRSAIFYCAVLFLAIRQAPAEDLAVLKRRAAAARAAAEKAAAGSFDRRMARFVLATALWRQGEQETGTTQLEEAATIYEEVLTSGPCPPPQQPILCPAARTDLGSVQRVLGTRKKDVGLVCKAVHSHIAAYAEMPADQNSGAKESLRDDVAYLKAQREPAARACLDGVRDAVKNILGTAP